MVNGFARTIKSNIKLSGSAQFFRGRTWPSANILEGFFQEQGRNPVPLGMGGCQIPGHILPEASRHSPIAPWE